MREAITPGSVNEPYEKTVSTPLPIGEDAPSTKKHCCRPTVLGATAIGVGVYVLIIAIAFDTVLPPVVTKKINDGVAVCSNHDISESKFTDAYGDCDDCTPYYYRLSMMNVTNAQAYLKGEKLKVTEVGPYAYRRFERKVDVHLEQDYTLVSYKKYTYHVFDSTLSCATCNETDQVISWDVGYLNVMSQSGGEVGFLRKLVKGSLWGSSYNDTQMEELITTDGPQIIRWMNGLNSNQPTAWKTIYKTVLEFLGAGVLTNIRALDLSGFEYNGLFATRPISDWALGYPSLLAGLGLASQYVGVCSATDTAGVALNDKCAKCKGESASADCAPLFAQCKTCHLGELVVGINNITCPIVEKKMADVYGEEEGKAFVAATCGNCALGICVAPLPGAAEDSGLDWSKTPPFSNTLNTYIQKTGCKDKSVIGDYVQFDGYTTSPFWATLNKRRNPTLAELAQFAQYGNCANPPSNTTCNNVMGNDGTSIKPAGVSILGFPKKVKLKEDMIYLKEGLQNVSLFNTGKVVGDIHGIKLTRFSPSNDLLTSTPFNAIKGTGYPVDGVQPLAFNVGFLAYLSYPMYLWGDDSLTDAVEITMFDGTRASKETMFENGVLKKEYSQRYQTYVDFEAGTGKAMRAHKRLMASYALHQSQFSEGKSMSDIVWPNLKAEVISPAYIGEEMSTIEGKLVEKYTSTRSMLNALVPVLIIGLVIGLSLVIGGCVYRRHAYKNVSKRPAGGVV